MAAEEVNVPGLRELKRKTCPSLVLSDRSVGKENPC